MIIEYARASYGIMPILLAARPTNVLTRAALTMLPILVFSDLSTQKHIHVIYPLLSYQEKSYAKINTKRERFTTFFTQMQTWPIEIVIGEHYFHSFTYEAQTRLGWCCTRHGVWHPTWLPTRQCRVWAYFFFTDSLQLSSIRADSASIHAELGRFGQNQAISTKLGRIDRRPKWPKQVEIDIESCQNSRNQLWIRPKHSKSVIP